MTLARQLLVILGLVILLAAAWWLFLRPADMAGTVEDSGPARAVPVEVATAETGRVSVVVESVGTARARQAVDVVANVSGHVVEILFRAGDLVEPGQPLLRLEDTIERASLAEARAVLDEAALQHKRARQLVADQTIPQTRLDELTSAHAVAQARFQAAERRLDERTVRAPFRGVVGLREVDVGARISGDTTITRLEDRSVMELQFQVPEVHYNAIRPGLRVVAAGAALPGREFAGTIAAVDSRIDEVSRAFRVRAELRNPEDLIPSGMFLRVSAELAVREQAVLVPEQAIVPEERASHVFRIVDGRAERVVVKLGQRQAGRVEIVSGIEAGDVVVVAGLQRLRSGAAVRILNRPVESRPAIDAAEGASTG